jgi:HSP20 family protein
MMMIPRRKNEFDLFDEMFNDPFFTRGESKLMKTDIKEKKDHYELEIDLPGYEKDNIQIELADGYLTVHASMNKEVDDEKDSKYVHKERYVGNSSRSFYVGDAVKEDEIKASFKNGTLKLCLPKEKEDKKEDKKYIDIE